MCAPFPAGARSRGQGVLPACFVAALLRRVVPALIAHNTPSVAELAELNKYVPPGSLDVYLKEIAASKEILRRVASTLDNVESRIAFMNSRYVQYDPEHAPPYAERLKTVLQALSMNHRLPQNLFIACLVCLSVCLPCCASCLRQRHWIC